MYAELRAIAEGLAELLGRLGHRATVLNCLHSEVVIELGDDWHFAAMILEDGVYLKVRFVRGSYFSSCFVRVLEYSEPELHVAISREARLQAEIRRLTPPRHGEEKPS